MTDVGRIEHDALGEVVVAPNRYWGAQTQRSLAHFDVGADRFRFTRPVIAALGLIKRCCADANLQEARLERPLAEAIITASEEVRAGRLDDHFPLVVFQTGSGTHTNMNANEVIANRANELLGGALGSNHPVHPNDHVNRSQSSNDVFSSVMHVAIESEVREALGPALHELNRTLAERARRFSDVVMVGRTHLQDAVPITLGQQIGDWLAQLEDALRRVDTARRGLLEIAIGATAVGTGLNAPSAFGATVAERLSEASGVDYRVASNLFAALSSHHAVVAMSASLRGLASALMKVANDVRWLASGPRAGIGELAIPSNEPGSSMMPGKVNPTQAEAVLMVAAQVFGNDAAVAFAGTQGNFQLNVQKPLILHNTLESVRLLTDACRSFDLHCARGIEPNLQRISEHLVASLMTVTALVPHVGYDTAAAIATDALRRGRTLRESALATGRLTGEQFDSWMVPFDMAHPPPEGGSGAH